MERWNRGLKAAGVAAGAAVVIYGLIRFFVEGNVPALLVALSVIVVGPGEDLLKSIARRRAGDPQRAEGWAALVDHATSLAFLLLLFAAVELLP